MKAFRCGDVVPGCDAEFLGADRADVLEQVARHARDDHRVELDATLAAQVAEHVRDA